MSDTEMPNQNSGCSEHPMDYLEKAAEACAAGDMTLGLHLYLAAYEKAASEPSPSNAIEVAALREAWHLACDLKDRSIAEHVFERLEPYLTREEIADCAQALQDLALERLEEYGFTREELQDMAEAITQDFLGIDGSVIKVEQITIPRAGMLPHVNVGDVDNADANGDIKGTTQDALVAEPSQAVEATPVVEAAHATEQLQSDEDGKKAKRGKNLGMSVSDVFNPYDTYPESSEGKSWRDATNIGSGWSESVGFDGTTVLDKRFEGFTRITSNEDELAEADGASPAMPAANADETTSRSTGEASFDVERTPSQAADQTHAESRAATSTPAQAHAQDDQAPSAQSIPTLGMNASAALAKPEGNAIANTPSMPSTPNVPALEGTALNYRNLKGYEEAISIMRDYGVGLQNDPGFISFVGMLNKQHGLSRMPAADTMLFRAPALEDATRFVDATIGELGLPVLRVAVEESVQGMPMLCFTTDANNRPRMNRQQNRFQGPAILVLDDLSLWRTPEIPESSEGGMNAFIAASMSRGAREMVNFIRSAVEDPDVFVLVTSPIDGAVEPYFYDMLEPLTIIDIGNPTERERRSIWSEILHDHPSTRNLVVDDLVRFSAGMARFDIYIAAREAVEEAYKQGLVQRTFVPVSTQNIFDKLAAMQPLDSDEYHALEERVVNDFVNSLDELESLLDSPRKQADAGDSEEHGD